MQKKIFLQKLIKKGLIILFWLLVWQLAASMAHNDILLVGPLQVGRAFLGNIAEPDFYRIVFHSLCRIGLGFLTALLFGLAAGACSYRYPYVRDVLSPVITTLKAIPVASFVVLLLIWFGAARLSFWISFFIVFPNVYVNTVAGLQSTDERLLEMARTLGMPGWNRAWYLYRPALMPYLVSCLKISLGMSWKSGVAAEVIGLPAYSLGERLYLSKIYLDTAGVFAWTLTIILLSFCFEKLVMMLVSRIAGWEPPLLGRASKERMSGAVPGIAGCAEAIGEDICVKNVSKAYGEEHVLCGFSCTIEAGGRYCLMAPSGSGKTTLFRLISRMERADEGSIEGVPEQIGMVFQEDRLCESYDTLTNIMLTMDWKGTGNQAFRRAKIAKKAREEAARILPEDCLTKPVSELSGGMRRRCAILRAMLSGADVIMMDEPFTGLDEENRRRTAAYIMEKLSGRTLIVTTHRGQDAELLDAVLLAYPGSIATAFGSRFVHRRQSADGAKVPCS